MKLKKFIENFITNKPVIFSVLFLLYFLTGIVAIHDPLLKQINLNLSIEPLTAFVWIFGILSFLSGIKYFKLLQKISVLPVFFVFILGIISFHYILNMEWVEAIIINFLTLVFAFIFLNMEKLPVVLLSIKNSLIILFFIGVFIFILNFYLVGIQLLNLSLHYDLILTFNQFFVMGFYFMLLSLMKLYNYNRKLSRILFLLILFLTILSTSRSFLGIVTFSWIFLESESLKGSKKKIIVLSSIVLFALVIFMLIGHFLEVFKESSWKLTPLRTLEYRVGFTLSIFNDIVKKSFPFGYSHGESMLFNTPGKFICKFYNCYAGLSSTAIGELMLDFGLPGIFIVMFYCGGVVQSIYKTDYPIYCLMISHLIVSIEVGINIFLILLITYLGYMRFDKWKLKKLV